MALSLYDTSIPVFLRSFETLKNILRKAEAFADETGLPRSDLLEARLFSDMLPLTGQIQRASDTAKFVAVRVGQVENVPMEDKEASFDELYKRIDRTVEILKSLPPEAMNGREDAEVVLTTRAGSHTYTGRSYLLEFALPNFFFHMTTAYGILRHKGVPDNRALADGLTAILRGSGYVVDLVGDGASAEAAAAAQAYDLVILDLNLPEMDGLDVLRAMRARQNRAAVMILTARGSPEEKVRGLDLGADDYMIKPFDVPEFEARIRVLLRRQAGLRSSLVNHGGVTFDLTSRTFSSNGVPLDIPAREVALLELLFLRIGKVVSKDAIMASLTGYDEDLSANAIEQYVSRRGHGVMSLAKSRKAASYSLRRRLLAWLLVSTALIGAVAMADTWDEAIDTANEVSDRVLAGSALAIAERVVVSEHGSLEVDIPYVALEMLTSAAQDRVFYRVDGPPGTFITGYQTLPSIERREGQAAAFADSLFRGEPIRVAALTRSASTGINSVPFTVTVAETTFARQQLTRAILIRSALRILLMILGAAVIVWVAVTLSLRPLYRFSEALAERSPDDLHPITQQVPSEVEGLVETVNSFMVRLEGALSALRHFTGNAGHQLRTPLAIVRTQLALAKRASDGQDAQKAVEKADEAVAHAERILAQLLLMARIDAASRPSSLVAADLADLARSVTADHVPQAAEAGIDLGFEGDYEVNVAVEPVLIGELVKNLVSNAILYAGTMARAFPPRSVPLS
eukprot:g25393.t1